MDEEIPFTLLTFVTSWRFVWLGRVYAQRQAQANAIYAWCTEQFGRPQPDTWRCITNSYGIQFDLYQPEIAVAFKMRWYTGRV